MGDDIDDLLDEVESKFCKPAVSSSTKKNETKSVPKVFSNTSTINTLTNRKERHTRNNEIDDAIDDIMSDGGFKVSQTPSVTKQPNGTHVNIIDGGAKLKCFPIFVGGSEFETGVASSSNKRTCNRLHCTSCDNHVVMFDDYKWQEEKCEYLAFRNNYPDFSRLKSLLSPRKGCRAYCCQCSWLTASAVKDLKSERDFKWICKRH